MSSDKDERFALLIDHTPSSDGSLNWSTKTLTLGVPEEIVLSQLRSLLRLIEDSYFENFKRSSPSS